MSLSKNELKMIAELLDCASNEFSNHSCNDYDVKNTPDNKKLLIDIVKWNEGIEGDSLDEDVIEEIENIKNKKSKTITYYDWVLMSYLAARCQEESE